jgi:dipeptidase E
MMILKIFIKLTITDFHKKMKTNAIIASTSTLFGGEYLDYLLPVLENHFANCKTILFIPYARPGGISHQNYTAKVAVAFAKIDKKVVGINQIDDPQTAIMQAEAVFVGGGNTFLLVTELYRNKIMTVLSKAVKNGLPYLGTSAGSNICGISMQNTNDMPIIYPPSFDTLGILPFNLNPHYLDPDPKSTHNGETRETRIAEFHIFNKTPVLGWREGSWLEVKAEKILLKGSLSARIFEKNNPPYESEISADLSFLK